MKKLLKSILIATASLGAIAGSTAAVISCGSNSGGNNIDPKAASQANYDSAFSKIFTHFKTNPIFTISENDFQSFNVQSIVTNSIRQSIVAYVGTQGVFTPGELLSINIADSSGITVGPVGQGVFPSITLGTPETTTNFKIMIPAATGLTAKTTDTTMPIQFLITQSVTPVNLLYASVMNKINEYFKHNSIFSVLRGTGVAETNAVTSAIHDSVFNFLNLKAPDAILSAEERAALKSVGGYLEPDAADIAVTITSGWDFSNPTTLGRTDSSHQITISMATSASGNPQGAAVTLDNGINYVIT